MNIGDLKVSKIQIIVIILLLIGLIVGLFLVQKQQIFRGRAEVEVSSGLDIKGGSGEKVECSGQVCETEANEVTIEVTDPNVFLKE